MKRLHLFIVMCLLSLTSGLQAQEQAEAGEQLLVFRNTGVVDLLYTNEVDSILTNDSTQVFYAKDTVLVVPIAELDSVAVGSRNEMKFHDGVKELKKTEDLPWIIRFDGQIIYYRTNTPANILPTVGTKLFYGLEHNPTLESVFPYGLCAKVVAVIKKTDEIEVEIADVEIDEIFSRLFYAGTINNEEEIAATRRRAPREHDINMTLETEVPIKLGDMGNITVKGQAGISGKLITDIGRKKKYYHADLDVDYGFGFNVKLKSNDSGSEEYDQYGDEKLIGTINKVIDVYGSLGSYIEAEAKLAFDLDMNRTYHKKLLWTRNDKKDDFEFRDANAKEPYADSLKASVTLDGKISFGPALRIDFAIVGLRLGARAKLKVGPEVEGHVNVTLLESLRNYNAKLYGSAELGICGKAKIEAYTINRHYWIMGIVDEHLIWEHPFYFAKRKWNLFPEFTHSNAVAKKKKQKDKEKEKVVVEVATAVPDTTLVPVEMGYEIVNPQQEVVDSVFEGTIESKADTGNHSATEENFQTFDTEIPLPPTINQADLEGYTMRPVFHYAGYTISAAPVGIRKDVLLQPYSATQTNGAMTFIGNSPFLGSAVKDSTLYQVGMYLPVPLKNNVYQQGKDRRIITGTPIDDYRSGLLIGTWTGKVNGEDVTLTFNEDETGEFNNVAFVYELNSPQSGDLVLKFGDGEPMILRLLSVTEVELKLKDKRDKEQTVWTLTR